MLFPSLDVQPVQLVNDFVKITDNVLGPEDCFSLQGDQAENEGETRGRRYRRELSDAAPFYMF